MTAKAILDKARALPVAERLSLVQELWDSIAADDASLPLDAQHACVIDERLKADQADPNATVSWAEAKAEARRQVAKAKRKK